MFLSVNSLSAVQDWLNTFERQTTGITGPVCQTGELYVEFFELGLSRPADVRIIEKQVATAFRKKLSEYFEGKEGTIYWRIPFEYAIEARPLVIRPDLSSEEIDPLTGMRTLFDKDWMAVKAYCRVFRASKKQIDETIPA